MYILVLLVSTASIQRAFSIMNIVKTKLDKIEDNFLEYYLVTFIERVIAKTFSIYTIIYICIPQHERAENSILDFSFSKLFYFLVYFVHLLHI